MKKLVPVLLGALANECMVMAQKVPTIKEVVSIAESTSKDGWALANWIIIIVLAIGAVLLVLSFVTEHPKKREFLIGYLTALVIWGALNVLLNK